jgi:hypothetical protein
MKFVLAVYSKNCRGFYFLLVHITAPFYEADIQFCLIVQNCDMKQNMVLDPSVVNVPL